MKQPDPLPNVAGLAAWFRLSQTEAPEQRKQWVNLSWDKTSVYVLLDDDDMVDPPMQPDGSGLYNFENTFAECVDDLIETIVQWDGVIRGDEASIAEQWIAALEEGAAKIRSSLEQRPAVQKDAPASGGE